MKTLTKTLLATSLAMAGMSTNALVVTQNNDGTDLANAILGAGITINSTTITGADAAFGTFTGGNASGLDIDAGIILSSGSVVDAVGPNSSGGTTTAHGTPGDADLSTISGGTTFDAALFTIEFESTGGDVFFNYIFASEEYNEYVGSSFNDAFGLFLDGVNIALLADGVTPVTINNVNGGTTPGLFNDNEFGGFDIEYDGFTTGFTASAFGLSAGTHTLTFAIADVADSVLDSAVFIQAGSLTDTDPTAMTEPSTLLLVGAGLFMAGFSRRRFNK